MKWSFRAHASRSNIFALCFYLLALSLPWSLDRIDEFLRLNPYKTTDPWYLSIAKPDYWYQRITSVGQAEISPSVSVVTIKEGREPDEALGDNWCSARLFLARLLVRIDWARPRIIVVDRWYRPHNPNDCVQGDATTKELARTIADVSQRTPIVIAAESVNYMETPAFCDVELRNDTLILRERVRFEEGNKNVYYGLARFNENDKKIPLGWFTYADCRRAQLGQNPTLMATLPLVSVAVAYGIPVEALLKRVSLKSEFNEVHHPFAHFREPLPNPKSDGEKYGFPGSSALRILCGDLDTSHWRTCENENPDDLELKKLHSQIVLIGELQSNDVWQSAIGQMPGMMFHANFIDSLMSPHFFKPLRAPFQIIASLVWFILIEAIFRWKASFPELALVISLLVSLLMGFVFYSVLLVYFGFYAVLAPPTLVAILGRWTSLRFEKIHHQEAGHGAQVLNVG